MFLSGSGIPAASTGPPPPARPAHTMTGTGKQDQPLYHNWPLRDKTQTDAYNVSAYDEF